HRRPRPAPRASVRPAEPPARRHRRARSEGRLPPRRPTGASATVVASNRPLSAFVLWYPISRRKRDAHSSTRREELHPVPRRHSAAQRGGGGGAAAGGSP